MPEQAAHLAGLAPELRDLLLLSLDETSEPDLRDAIVEALMGDPDEDPGPAYDPTLSNLDKVGATAPAQPACFDASGAHSKQGDHCMHSRPMMSLPC